jgi:hypothetical protein
MRAGAHGLQQGTRADITAEDIGQRWPMPFQHFGEPETHPRLDRIFLYEEQRSDTIPQSLC